jgi:nucleotide-binding universal stress UspA family protein
MTALPAIEHSSGDYSTEHLGNPVLVVGMDDSPPSWDAFSWAAGEAQRRNGRIVAVFATPLGAPNVAAAVAVAAPMDYAAVAESEDQIAEQLRSQVEQRADELGVEVSFMREYGDPAQALRQVAGTVHADLIVVGRSAKRLHHFAGSLSRRLVLNHKLPVIVVVP